MANGSRQISTAIENAVDRYGLLGNVEGYCDATAIADNAQTCAKIVSASSAFRKYHEPFTVRDDAIGEPSGSCRPRLLRDILVDLENVLSGFRRENNLMRHASPS